MATINLLSVVLDLLAKLNCFMQRKATDLSRLPIILKSIVSERKHLKDAGTEWCSLVKTSIAMLATDHGITMRRSSTRSDSATTMSGYRAAVAIPYIDALVSNINSHFSDSAVNLLVSSSIFNPVSFPTDEAALPEFGNNELKVLLNFYGKEAQAEFGGKTYTAPPLIDGEEILSEWRVFKIAFAKQKKALMKKNQLSKTTNITGDQDGNGIL